LKFAVIASLVFILLIGCGRDRLSTIAGCVVFETDTVSTIELSRHAQDAAELLGYTDLTEQQEGQFLLVFTTREGERSLVLASQPNSGLYPSYFITVHVENQDDQAAYGLDAKKLLAMLEETLPSDTVRLVTSTCSERPN
jgi:hypothetical protein